MKATDAIARAVRGADNGEAIRRRRTKQNAEDHRGCYGGGFLRGPRRCRRASKKKKQKVRAKPPVTYVAPANLRTPGPPWAGPGECYTDEGYGRYSPCGEGKDM
jgi:hypothetical protein